jgi:hypothetical protein
MLSSEFCSGSAKLFPLCFLVHSTLTIACGFLTRKEFNNPRVNWIHAIIVFMFFKNAIITQLSQCHYNSALAGRRVPR